MFMFHQFFWFFLNCGGIFVTIVEVFLSTLWRYFWLPKRDLEGLSPLKITGFMKTNFTQWLDGLIVLFYRIQIMSKILASGWTNWYFESLKNQLYTPKLSPCWDISPSCQLFKSFFWPYNYFDMLCQKWWHTL